MRKALDKALLQQGEDDKRVNHQRVMRIVAGRLFRVESDALKCFGCQVWPFPSYKFYKFVYLRCTNWCNEVHTVSQSVSDTESSVIHDVTFQLVYDHAVERDDSITKTVSVQRVHDLESGATSRRYKYNCILAQTSKFPYVHFTTVYTQYMTYSAAFSKVRTSLDTRYLNIGDHFHIYWNHHATPFVGSSAYIDWEQTEVTAEVSQDGGTGEDHEQEWERVAPEERAQLNTYSVSKSLHGQAFRLVNSFGPSPMPNWD